MCNEEISLDTKLDLVAWEQIFDITISDLAYHIRQGRIKGRRIRGHPHKAWCVSVKGMADFIANWPFFRPKYKCAMLNNKDEYSDIFDLINNYLETVPIVHTTVSLAEKLGVSRSSIRNWIQKGYLTYDLPWLRFSEKSWKGLFEKYPKALFYQELKEQEDKIRNESLSVIDERSKN